ncbi:uncharacterized protein LOC117169235 isoform X2 [Belonocnema kinseyi]|nr:uncharacterized protein LOC117169235 isoform X2 [Belonocnema kinseyi]
MIFAGVTSLSSLQQNLEEEFFYAELLQWADSTSAFVILGTFETNLADLLYPSPCFKGLLAGVDVDLLMEPTKFFPGILAPKIEVSTKTVVEEVLGICDSNMIGPYIVNPKVIHSKNYSSINRKHPPKGIIRQRKVCHSRGKSRQQPCRPCKKVTRLKARSCSPVTSDRHTQTSSDQCYHKLSKRHKCSCSQSQKSSIARESHKFDSCHVCSKYKCYFSEHPQEKGEPFCSKNLCNNSEHSSSRVYEPMRSLNNSHNSHIKKEYDCDCRPNSAPSLQQDPAVSVLKNKMRRLQTAKEKLACTSDYCKESACVCEPSSDYSRNRGRPGFYKNLEKFYKRLYKQAKMRAEEMDCL